jgi:hypothetical protein
MALKNIIGLDHVVIQAAELDKAADNWRSLGFTVSDRGTHSAVMGTGNYTIMLGEDYIELLGVLTATERNAPARAFIARRGDGMERVAFTAVDSMAGLAEIQSKGLAGTGPFDFSRPVTMPDGSQTEARFRTFLWPIDERPGDLRIFACQHFTRDAVWIPNLQRHENTARRIIRVELLAKDPKSAAEHMARLIDQAVAAEPDGSMRVPTGGRRADFVFMDRKMLASRHPGVPLDSLPPEGAVALCLAVASPDAARAALGDRALEVRPGVVAVAPEQANGVILEFSEA